MVKNGPDALAEKYADAHKIPKKILFPYKNLGKNFHLLDIFKIASADLVIIFWDGKSCGVNFAVKAALAQGKKFEIRLVK